MAFFETVPINVLSQIASPEINVYVCFSALGEQIVTGEVGV